MIGSNLTSLNAHNPPKVIMKHGVPQGSVLGHYCFLFILMIYIMLCSMRTSIARCIENEFNCEIIHYSNRLQSVYI